MTAQILLPNLQFNLCRFDHLGQAEIVQLLLDHSASVNLRNINNGTALIVAASNGFILI